MDIGGTVDLECSVQYAEEYPVLWVKKGTEGTQDLPISTNTALIVRDSRYALRHDRQSSTYILQVNLFIHYFSRPFKFIHSVCSWDVFFFFSFSDSTWFSSSDQGPSGERRRGVHVPSPDRYRKQNFGFCSSPRQETPSHFGQFHPVRNLFCHAQ